jgi:sugar (pentulose or hexulose) kinase
MKNPLILTFDVGSQSVRALLIDQNGNILAKEQIKISEPLAPKPGYAEHKPETFTNAFNQASKKIHINNPKLVNNIVGVTITTIRNTFVCVDKQGKALRNIIMWMDQRETEGLPTVNLINQIGFRAVGMMEALLVQRKITKANWIQKYQKEIWAKTYKYMTINGYLTLKLTNQFKDSLTNIVGHVPLDYKNRKWYKKSAPLAEVFNVSLDRLPELVEPGTIIGNICKQASALTMIKEGLPLIASGSDKGCETLGTGVLDNNMASLSFGTAATVQTSTRKYIEPQKFMPAYPAVVKGFYNSEVQIFSGYWMISWFKKEFAEKEVKQAEKLGISAEQVLNRVLKNIPPGSDNLILQPYWSPLLKNPEAKGSIIGFGRHHTRAHIYKAMIEGIGFALLEGLKGIEQVGKFKVEALTVSGGGSQSDEICQITADMFGVPVKRIQTYESSGLGSAMIGFVALKIHPSYQAAIKKMVRYKSVLKPNAKNHEIYTKLYNNVYSKIYASLKPIYQEIK